MAKLKTFIDLETTGLSPLKNNIIQVHITITDENWKIVKQIDRYYNSNQLGNIIPTEDGPKTVSEFTGLSENFLKQNHSSTPLIEDKEVKQALMNDYVVAYNASFERKWLLEAFKGDSEVVDHLSKNSTWKDPYITLKNHFDAMSIKEKDFLDIAGIDYDPNKLHNAKYDIEKLIEAIAEVSEKGFKKNIERELPTEKQLKNNPMLQSKYSGMYNYEKLSKEMYMPEITRSEWVERPPLSAKKKTTSPFKVAIIATHNRNSKIAFSDNKVVVSLDDKKYEVSATDWAKAKPWADKKLKETLTILENNLKILGFNENQIKHAFNMPIVLPPEDTMLNIENAIKRISDVPVQSTAEKIEEIVNTPVEELKEVLLKDLNSSGR